MKKLLCLFLLSVFILGCRLPNLVLKPLSDRAGTWESAGYEIRYYLYLDRNGNGLICTKTGLGVYKNLGTYSLGDPSKFVDGMTIGTYDGRSIQFMFDDNKISIQGETLGFYKIDDRYSIPLEVRIGKYEAKRGSSYLTIARSKNNMYIDIALNGEVIATISDYYSTSLGHYFETGNISFKNDGTIYLVYNDNEFEFKRVL